VELKPPSNICCKRCHKTPPAGLSDEPEVSRKEAAKKRNEITDVPPYLAQYFHRINLEMFQRNAPMLSGSRFDERIPKLGN
jgi:hypothetical protein